jgi:hypothetical protein
MRRQPLDLRKPHGDHHFVSEFSLCLSRACLDKMIIFSGMKFNGAKGASYVSYHRRDTGDQTATTDRHNYRIDVRHLQKRNRFLVSFAYL